MRALLSTQTFQLAPPCCDHLAAMPSSHFEGRKLPPGPTVAKNTTHGPTLLLIPSASSIISFTLECGFGPGNSRAHEQWESARLTLHPGLAEPIPPGCHRLLRKRIASCRNNSVVSGCAFNDNQRRHQEAVVARRPFSRRAKLSESKSFCFQRNRFFGHYVHRRSSGLEEHFRE